MIKIHISAQLTPNGKLDYQLPDELPNEDFELVLRVSHAEPLTLLSIDLTDEERAYIGNSSKPMTLGEMLANNLIGLGEDLAIEDSVAWVTQQRNKWRED